MSIAGFEKLLEGLSEGERTEVLLRAYSRVSRPFKSFPSICFKSEELEHLIQEKIVEAEAKNSR